MDWNRILRQLDQPSSTLFDARSVAIVLQATKAVWGDISMFPTSFFLGRWNNKVNQIQFLIHACQIATEIFWNPTVTKYIVNVNDFGSSNAARYFVNSCMKQCWNNWDLIALIIEYSADAQYAQGTGRLIDLALEQAPEILLLAFARMDAGWNPWIKNLAPKLVVSVINGHPQWQVIISALWEYNPLLVVSGLALMFLADNSTLGRAIDIAQELKCLPEILEMKPYGFTIPLAGLASRRDFLNLEKWIQDMIRKDPEDFVRACLAFVNDKIATSIQPHQAPTMHNFISTILRVLQGNRPYFSAENASIFDSVASSWQQLALKASDGGGIDGPVEPASFPKDVEDEVNSFYESVYQEKFPIADVVEEMVRLQHSKNSRDQLVFKCMIHNLFDEYRFFPRYPERELLITSTLFGALILNRVFTSMALGVALRYILEALRQPIGTKMFQFGVNSLTIFEYRLKEWPQYCALLLQIDHLSQALPNTIREISTFSNPNAVASGDIAGARSPAQQHGNEGIFKSLRLEGLLKGIPMDPPMEAIQDRVLFILNNVTLANVEEKVNELESVLKTEHIRWFCNYIVVKRASIEPNFHPLYVTILESLNMKLIYPALLYETLSSICVLINSESTVNSSQERSSLKNLGAWLGSISLAKDRPIKHKHLAFKELLLEGYEHKRLIVVIPFVCKVLEQSSHSNVFKPPNPWINAIMKLLAELYYFAELKLNLKFEIEVLCKNLKLDINDIEPSSVLRMRAAQNPTRRYMPTESTALPQNRKAATEILANRQESDSAGIGFPSLSSFIVFNPTISLFNTQPSLKKIVHIAIDRSIREVMQSPVVERSVNIALNATREIITKDFALEPKEEKMLQAAQYMAQCLAGSLASVSSREPLKISMITNLRSLLAANGFSDQTVPEQVVFLIVGDNLDLACSVMEKVAAEKSRPEKDERFVASLIARSKHRELRTGKPFYDPVAAQYLASLPEQVRPMAGGVTPNQMRLYEDFSRVQYLQNSATRKEQLDEEIQPRVAKTNQNDPSLENPNELLGFAKVIEKFTVLGSEIDQVLRENAGKSLESLDASHPVKNSVQKLFWLISQSANPDETCLLFAERIVGMLYATNSSLAREVFVLVLRRFFDLSKTLPRELKDWFLYSEDDRKFNQDIYLAIMKADLVTSHEVDLHLARLLEHGNEKVHKFVIGLLSLCCLGDKPGFLYTEFLHTMRGIKHQVLEGESSTLFNPFLAEIRKMMAIFQCKSLVARGTDLLKCFEAIFEEWVEISSHSGIGMETQTDFIKMLLDEPLVSGNNLAIFIRTCLDLSVKYAVALKENNAGSGNPYVAIDSLARMWVLLIRHYKPDNKAITTSQELWDNLISVAVLCIIQSHETLGTKFSQKPFLRLFSSILNELKELQLELAELYYYCIASISYNYFN